FNKYIEIYNGTGAPVDLSNYALRLYSNGSGMPNSNDNLGIAGILAHGDVAVFGHGSAAVYAGTVFPLGAVNFNGDDAVELYNTALGQTSDIIGEIGNDPGTAWTDGAHTTVNATLRRTSDVIQGISVNPSGFPTLTSEWDVLAQDDVSGLGSHSMNATGSSPVVTLTITDIHNNVSTCQATVTVEDNILPTITAPGDISITADNGVCESTAVVLGSSTTDDNCGVASVTNDAPAIFPIGPTTVTWTVTDHSGNQQTGTQLVTVTDDEAPVITLLGDAVVELCEGQPYIDAGVSASDNCDEDLTGSVVTVNPVDVNVPDTYTVIYNVTDAASNQAMEVTRTVIV